MIAMILAAGRGERLRPLTETIPKALVEVRGKSLLEWRLEAARAAGVETVVINLGWLGAEIAAKIGGGERYGLNVLYSPEGDNILETGGGIRRALPLLGDQPFLVMNADVFTDMPLPDISLPAGIDGHLVLVPRPAYRPHGDFDLDAGYVRNNDEPGLTFSGIAVYRPEFFAEHPVERFPLAPLLRAAADARTLTGSLYEGTWEDVGTPERLAAVNRG